MKLWPIALLLPVIICLAAILHNGNTPQAQPQPPQETSSSTFEVAFKFGILSKNELNTFEGTYTKDLILDEPVTTSLVLTEAEKADLRKQIIKLDVLHPQNDHPGMMRFPCDSYDLLVEDNGVRSHVVWDGCQDGINDAMASLEEYIRDLVETKPAYQELPAHRGGYM